jgi:PKD repeat protein
MTFNVTKRGSSPLKLTNVHLSGEGGVYQSVLCHAFDGLFHTVDAPTADFTFWPDIGVVDKPVIFNASASYSPVNASISKYVWDFDDETNATVSDPIISHLYNETGDYTVSLVVEDSNGTRSNPKTEELRVVMKRNVKIVDVSLMPADNVLVNSTVDVEVRVENDAKDVDENCTVRAYYNATAVNLADISTANWTKIGEINVSIARDSFSIEHLTWNTTGVPQVDAYYYVLVNATLVPYEDVKDNNMTSSDAILVTSTPLRDVAVEKLELGWRMEEGASFKSPVLDGETTTFQITVQNSGTGNETAVNVTLYHDGSMLKNWNESIPRGQTIELTCTELFDPGTYNITALATIENDAHPDNNRKQETLQVIETPKLNFTYDPKTIYINQTVSLDASASFHREPGASITEYKWQIYDRTDHVVKTLSGPDLVNITYQFGQEGEWRVVLSVTDSYNIKYNRQRANTVAYQVDQRIDVQAPAGFPIEYILVVIVIVVAALAVIIYRRRRAHT